MTAVDSDQVSAWLADATERLTDDLRPDSLEKLRGRVAAERAVDLCPPAVFTERAVIYDALEHERGDPLDSPHELIFSTYGDCCRAAEALRDAEVAP